ncbi:MAG: FAD-binding oxidoreductase [Gemmatimonadaceae bacterium]
MNAKLDQRFLHNGMPDEAALAGFKSLVRGTLLTPESPDYNAVRTIWNAMIDRKPAIIVRCAGAADVMKAVTFAREHSMLISVRGGGHSAAGSSLCDGGLMIDLSLMRGLRVDPVSRTARAEPGVLWKEFDHETSSFGLVTTGGTVSTTGVGGLTLGGGLGWQMSRLGLTCDNLLSADIVTADGLLLTASEASHPELFWAVRGGGGNFGIVVSFEYQVHPIHENVLAGMILYPMDQARDVLRFYRESCKTAGDDLAMAVGLLTLPDGMDVIAVIAAWLGAPEVGEEKLASLRAFGSPIADLIAPQPYCQFQQIFDAAVPSGMRRYWKSGYVPDFSDDFIDEILRHAALKPSPYTAVLIFHLHGAATRVAGDATAFGARTMQWDFDIIPQWLDASEDVRHLTWARTFWAGVEPYTSGVYVNHLGTDDGASRVKAAFGQNFARLVQIKSKYDPDNVFRLGNNIPVAE